MEDNKTTAHDVEQMLIEMVGDGYDVESIRTYENAGLLTHDKGVMLKFTDGTEFQITILQSH